MFKESHFYIYRKDAKCKSNMTCQKLQGLRISNSGKRKKKRATCCDTLEVCVDVVHLSFITITFVKVEPSSVESFIQQMSIVALILNSNFDCYFTGIGYTLDPDFSFVKVAAPYAQVPYVSLKSLLWKKLT